MPSVMPVPARRMLMRTTFLPSITGARMVANGVSIVS